MKPWIEISIAVAIFTAIVVAGVATRDYMAMLKRMNDPALRYEQPLSSLTMVQHGRQITVIGMPDRIERHVSRCERDPECVVISHE